MILKSPLDFSNEIMRWNKIWTMIAAIMLCCFDDAQNVDDLEHEIWAAPRAA